MTRYSNSTQANALNQSASSGQSKDLPRPSQTQFAPLMLLGRTWNYVAEVLSWLFASPHQPHIRECRDRTGQTCWRVHDPASGQSMVFYTEQEVCAWLEQRWSRYMR
ncbi:MAG: hypothetical protein EDM05_002165 [Leptolyngbya sp. IPPAS B-1204]|uniref:Uncharacterized protein n=1 Tax=Leptolyngbya sp. NK1-12 TaxID=2547451 RepID=A0AA96WNM0_9CYAN|nr:hypothetical protein [Leptolyngbya sp. NK1-12]MBF2046593.1 hypothetical protein [Elainella sp. C42_A2020_010]WNZ25911.1 hypothetical protein HJG54_25835 [Leptolyngbya sp. NK1-12]